MDKERDKFKEFCYSNSVLIHIGTDLKTSIRGYCYYDGMYYNIIVNAKYGSFQLRKTTIHEIIHILQDHFSRDVDDIQKCEAEVKEIIGRMRLSFA